LIICGSGNANDGHNVFTETHARGANEKEFTTAEIVNCPHTRECRNDIDDVGDDGDNKWIRDTSLGEECGSVVEDKLEKLV